MNSHNYILHTTEITLTFNLHIHIQCSCNDGQLHQKVARIESRMANHTVLPLTLAIQIQSLVSSYDVYIYETKNAQ